MTIAQKIIKYFAYALAASIIASIIFGFLSFIKGMSYIENNDNNKEMVTTNFENLNISTLDINLANTNLTIKTGDIFKVDTNSEDLTIEQTNNKLYIKEKSQYSFWNIGKEDLIIHIPDNILFSDILINTGAGRVNIEELSTNEISFKIGAGDFTVNKLYVIDKAYIKSGVGKISLLNSRVNNLNFELGVGKTDITGVITGINNIKTGVGELNINLTDKEDNYKILVSKGIGKITIDKNEVSNNFTYGNGINYIKLEGGIGSTNVSFVNNAIKKED